LQRRLVSVGRIPGSRAARRWRFQRALAAALISGVAADAGAQSIHGAIASAVGAQRIAGAVVLLLDTGLAVRARALTSDSGAFVIGAGVPGRFRLRIMRIGFRPSETPEFDLRRDTTVALALTDIPVILPAVTTRDRNDCRLHPDTSDIGRYTFALWEQARTALLAAAITQEREEYKFSELVHYRVYNLEERTLDSVALHEIDTHGSAPWTTLRGEQLRERGYTAVDDSGMTFFAPDINVLLSPYFTEEHCFRLTAKPSPLPGAIGIDFEPAERPRHTEIHGTIWLDSASTELRIVRFAFVNLPLSAPDTLIGGHLEFLRLTTGAWIMPRWSIRMPTPVIPAPSREWVARFGASATSRRRWRLTTDQIRVAGGDVRTVRTAGSDTLLWSRATGSVRVTAYSETEVGQLPAGGAFVRLTGSPYGAESDVFGHLRFVGIVPGTYLFEATTPLHEAIQAIPERIAVTVQPDETLDARVALKPLARAAAEVCKVRALDHDAGVIVGHVTHEDVPAEKVRITVEWPGDERTVDTRQDGYYRICNVPAGKLLLVRASREDLMATVSMTLRSGELVRQRDLILQR